MNKKIFCLLESEELGLHVSFCLRMTKLLNRSFTGLNVFNLLSQTQADRSLNLSDCFSQMSQRDGDGLMRMEWKVGGRKRKSSKEDVNIYKIHLSTNWRQLVATE